MKNTSTLKRITDAVAAYRATSEAQRMKAERRKLKEALDGTGSSLAVRSAHWKLRNALEKRWLAQQAGELDQFGQIDNEIDELLDELKQLLEGGS